MAVGVDEILGWEYITTSVQLTESGLPKVFNEKFYTLTEEVLGNKGSYIQSFGQRKVARAVPYGAPGKAMEKLDLQTIDFKLVNFREVLPLDMELTTIFRQWDQYQAQQKYAMQQVAYHGRNARTLFDNVRTASIASTLAYGAMYFDTDGVLLPNSSGAATTIDQGIPAENQGQITDVDGSTIINVSWADPNCNIVEQINKLKALALKRTGKELKYAYYGAKVQGYISNNAQSKSYFNFADSGALARMIQLDGKIPAGFMGLEWVPAQTAYFEYSDGTLVNQFPEDRVTFFPEITPDTYTLYLGTTLVPTSVGLFGTPEQAFASTKLVTGMGGFARYTPDTMQIIANYFDVFLPRIRNPRAVFLADVTP